MRNRVAQADGVRDELQVRQSEIRLQQLADRVRLDLEDAFVNLQPARASYEAAVRDDLHGDPIPGVTGSGVIDRSRRQRHARGKSNIDSGSSERSRYPSAISTSRSALNAV